MQGQDLASGNLTAPVLFALQSAHGDELLDLIDSEFVEEGDLQRAIELVTAGGGVAAAKRLASEEADKVLKLLHVPACVCLRFMRDKLYDEIILSVFWLVFAALSMHSKEIVAQYNSITSCNS